MPAVALRVEGRLGDDVGVALQELDHEAVVDRALLVQAVEHRVVPERRPALVHHLGLALRIEILRDLAHDAHELALPGLELRRVLLDEVEDVLLRLGREAPLASGAAASRGALGQGAPQVVELPLAVLLALGQPRRPRPAASPPPAAGSGRRRAASARGRHRAPPRPPRRRGAPRTPSRSGARTPGSRGWRPPPSTGGTGSCP